MKNLSWGVASLCFCLILVSCETLDLGGMMKSSKSGLPLNTVIAGLKEALDVGTENAVKSVSAKGGFAKSSLRRIVMPTALKPLEDKLRQFKLGFMVDKFDAKMNEAAEKASALATPVFLKAIKNMSFSDARNILNGGNSAATDYFNKATRAELRTAFKPVVKQSMDELGVVTAYDGLVSKYNALTFSDKINFKIEDYVTEKTLDGLFGALSQEEAKIREAPAARTTALLKQVFGK